MGRAAADGANGRLGALIGAAGWVPPLRREGSPPAQTAPVVALTRPLPGGGGRGAAGPSGYTKLDAARLPTPLNTTRVPSVRLMLVEPPDVLAVASAAGITFAA